MMRPAILVHGGAGPVSEGDVAEAYAQGCLAAARAGYGVLQRGGTALDAVEAAATCLEDDPLFNAGTGACLNEDGEVELDASLMDGRNLAAGAVSLVRDVKNPIRLARAVMERTRHVFLAGEGARRLAREVGIPFCDPKSLVTERARQRLTKEQPRPPSGDGGTIGAVAIDSGGHLAAATSTGGMVGKRMGRVGDSPIIGAGTYADDAAGAISMTGTGEAMLKVLAAKFAADRLRAGDAPDIAAQATVREFARVGGKGGIILVDRHGKLAFAFNSERMSRAWIDGEGREAAAFH